MRKYEEKEIKKTEEILTGIFCDVCKKEIKQKSEFARDIFYSVTTSDSHYGYFETIDSSESKDICSDECLQIVFNTYLENNSDSKCIKIENEYIDEYIENYKGE